MVEKRVSGREAAGRRGKRKPNRRGALNVTLRTLTGEMSKKRKRGRIKKRFWIRRGPS